MSYGASAYFGTKVGAGIAVTGTTAAKVGTGLSATGAGLGGGIGTILGKAGALVAATGLGPIGLGIVGGVAVCGLLCAATKLSERSKFQVTHSEHSLPEWQKEQAGRETLPLQLFVAFWCF